MPQYASNIQIPNLPVAISLSGTEQVEIVQSGTSARTTTQAIANLAQITTAPNYTTAQKNALTVTTGAVVFDTTLQKLCVYTATGWQTITSV
jgi:hypothetical protein